MDLELPVLTGYEAAARLRQSRSDARYSRSLPRPATRMHASSTERAEAGFDAVIVKPCDPDELVAQIRRLLELRRAAGWVAPCHLRAASLPEPWRPARHPAPPFPSRGLAQALHRRTVDT